ncbi:toxin, partial [Pseudomonas sp. RIT-PI-a]
LDSPYFRIALNRELVQNWDTTEARLRNLRHNRTLDGKPLQLPLFAAPLDPRALMSAYGSGATGGGAGRLLGQEIPHYRFNIMHNRASAAVENLIQFGSTLLSLLERKEGAQLQEMQQQQAWDMAKQAVVLQQLVQQVETEGRKALLASRAIAESRLAYYGKLADEVVNAGEVAAGVLHLQGRVMEGIASISQGIGEALKLPPNEVSAVGGVIAGGAGGAIVGAGSGGWRLEGATGIATAGAQRVATSSRGAAEALDRTEQYRRRHQEWMQAEEQAQREIEQIDAQLAVHDEQAKVTAEQLRQTEVLVEQAATTYQFLSKRFTSAQLYQWLNGQFATFYYQAYDTTLSLCLAAEACWQYEIADFKTRFVQPGAWKDSYRGLTAGESLKLNLMKMEAAYLQRNDRKLEITKTVSVRRLLETAEKPWTTVVQDLSKDGGLKIELSKALFERDYPDQYLRRIKRVSVTLPAVLGPYQNVAAMLTQTYSQVQMSADPDATPWENMRASQQIALSSGMDDDGMFTLNFDDERYLPFEGTGAVSNWNLKFTRSTPELLASLNDVILKISYTAVSA